MHTRSALQRVLLSTSINMTPANALKLSQRQPAPPPRAVPRIASSRDTGGKVRQRGQRRRRSFVGSFVGLFVGHSAVPRRFKPPGSGSRAALRQVTQAGSSMGASMFCRLALM